MGKVGDDPVKAGAAAPKREDVVGESRPENPRDVDRLQQTPGTSQVLPNKSILQPVDGTAAALKSSTKPRALRDQPYSPKGRLEGMVPFLAVFESLDFQIFSSVNGKRQRNDEFGKFAQASVNIGWVKPRFDSIQWANSEEAIRLFSSKEAMSKATPMELERVMTSLMRSERFNDNTLVGAYQSGLLKRILQRMVSLLEEGTYQ